MKITLVEGVRESVTITLSIDNADWAFLFYPEVWEYNCLDTGTMTSSPLQPMPGQLTALSLLTWRKGSQEVEIVYQGANDIVYIALDPYGLRFLNRDKWAIRAWTWAELHSDLKGENDA